MLLCHVNDAAAGWQLKYVSAGSDALPVIPFNSAEGTVRHSTQQVVTSAQVAFERTTRTRSTGKLSYLPSLRFTVTLPFFLSTRRRNHSLKCSVQIYQTELMTSRTVCGCDIFFLIIPFSYQRLNWPPTLRVVQNSPLLSIQLLKC